MEEKAPLQAGAQRYECTDLCKVNRNGYKPPNSLDIDRELELLKPQFREFLFETQVFDKYSSVEKVVLTDVAESYLPGVSARRMRKVMSTLGVGAISASSVFRIAKEWNKRINFLDLNYLQFLIY